MINNLFRTYKKIIISILVILSAAMFLFYSCHRKSQVEEKTVSWEKLTAPEGNGSSFRFETEALRGTVTFGAAGFIPRDKEVPVALQVSCKDDSFIGVMKITLPGQSGSGIDYQAAVSCVKGVVTRVDLQVPYLGNPSCFGFAIHDSFGTEEISQAVVPDWAAQGLGLSETADQDDYIYVGFVSDRPEKLAYLDDLEYNAGGDNKTFRMVYYSRANMPRRIEELKLLSGLVIDNADTSKLDESQKACLKEYVTQEEGILILALGRYHGRVLSGMGDLTGSCQVDTKNSGLVFTNRAINSENVRLTLSSLLSGDQKVWEEQGFSSPESCWTRKTGKGCLALVSFSFQDGVLLQWNSRNRVCADLLGSLLKEKLEDSQKDSISLWYVQKTLYAFLHSQMPNTFFYGCLFVLYLFLLVVFAYYFLRRRKKREWIWGVVPLLSILFTSFMAIRSLGIAGMEGSTLSAIRISDAGQEQDTIYFLYQNGEKEEADVNFLPSIKSVIPLEYSFRTDSTGEDNLVCSNKVLTVNHTKNGYAVLFDEQIPGSSRLLELSGLPDLPGQAGKRDAFTADLQAGKAAFEGTVKNISGKDMDTLLLVRGNEYVLKKNLAAGSSARIKTEDVEVYSSSLPANLSDRETSVVANLLSYVRQIYMNSTEGRDQVLLIGLTDKDDFSLFSDKNKLRNHISLFVNYYDMPGKEDITRMSNINSSALQESEEGSSLSEDYLERDWVEAQYAFDKHKLMWSLTREKDSFSGTIYAYNYDKKKREKILQRQGDSLGCEQLEPYLSEMNVMKLTYQLPNGVTQDVAPLISAELKDLEKVEEDAGISESDGAER